MVSKGAAQFFVPVTSYDLAQGRPCWPVSTSGPWEQSRLALCQVLANLFAEPGRDPGQLDLTVTLATTLLAGASSPHWQLRAKGGGAQISPVLASLGARGND